MVMSRYPFPRPMQIGPFPQNYPRVNCGRMTACCMLRVYSGDCAKKTRPQDGRIDYETHVRRPPDFLCAWWQNGQPFLAKMAVS